MAKSIATHTQTDGNRVEQGGGVLVGWWWGRGGGGGCMRTTARGGEKIEIEFLLFSLILCRSHQFKTLLKIARILK
jgi:hypothetical protein